VFGVKVIEHRQVNTNGTAKVQFLRIDPEDLSATLSDILTALMNLSWLSKFDEDYEIAAFTSRANKTIKDIEEKFSKSIDDKISKDAGEYVVSELAREAIVNELHYLDIPLAELLGKKKSGNPGFDFHRQNIDTDTVIFGESKYVTTTTAYSSALPQMVDFIEKGKDIEDLPELKPFCSAAALHRAYNGSKGFAAAFSAKSTKSDSIINNIIGRSDFQSLLSFEEVLLVAVNL
jgi:hypothetical protein